jgi:hypothetical protein
LFAPALRPGNVLIIDSSPLDVFAMDPLTGRAISLDLLLCIDACTSSIASFRLTSLGPKAIDATGILSDAIRGRIYRSDWPDYEARYLGLPDTIVFDERSVVGSETPARSNQRSYPADLVVVDHALIYCDSTNRGRDPGRRLNR